MLKLIQKFINSPEGKKIFKKVKDKNKIVDLNSFDIRVRVSIEDNLPTTVFKTIKRTTKRLSIYFCIK